MKLRELAINGMGVSSSLHVRNLNDGFSILYGEKGAGKTTVRNFVRDSIYGGTSSAYGSTTGARLNNGHLNVQVGTSEFQITRSPNAGANESSVSIRSLHPNSNGGTPSLDQVTSNLAAEVYDTVFNVSFRETPANARRLGSVLQNQLGVPSGPAAAGDDSGYLQWQRESNTRRERLATLSSRVDALTHEKGSALGQIETAKMSAQSQINEFERQISQIVIRLGELQPHSIQDQIANIDREIASLRLLIDNARTQVTYQPEVPKYDPNPSLYQRLDEIDNQIRRWRHVQSDIQTQRVRLRDEMLIWNELTLDSDEHPYHNARAILVSLESKVDEAERNANHWSDAGVTRIDTSQLARSLGELCKSMRDDLYGLCNELGQQYKHIRHKAAAAELKQLRRCYSEMGENIERLIDRRGKVIREIHEVDPAGADAILRSDAKFCECARHKGYLEARRKFIGHAPALPVAAPVYQTIQPNLDAERSRLVMLEQKRTELANSIARSDAEQSELSARHIELVRQRDALLGGHNFHELERRIQAIGNELRPLNEQYRILLQQIEQDREYVQVPPNPILQRAGQLISRVSSGNLTQVFLDHPTTSHIEIQVRDRHGKVLNFSAIEPGLQDQVYLCLILSVKEQLRLQGIETATLIDDAFSRIPSERVAATLSLLDEFAGSARSSSRHSSPVHQVIALTQHRYLADRLPGVPVLDLSPTMPTRPAHDTERRESVPLIVPTRDSSLTRNYSLEDTYSTITSPRPTVSSRPYPLSKYSQTNSARNRQDYTVAYPVEPTGPTEFVPRTVLTSESTLRNKMAPASPVAPVAISSFGDQLGYDSGLADTTPLDRVGFFDANHLRMFQQNGVVTIADLLELNQAQVTSLGFHIDQIDRWQSQLWLLINVSGMRLSDARALVACGITEPEQLDTSHPHQLFERVNRFFNTSEGRRFAGDQYGGNENAISLDRINGWYRSLDSTRSRWQNRTRTRAGGSSRSGRSSSFQPRAYSNDSQTSARTRRQSESRPSELRTSNRREGSREPRGPRMQAPRAFQQRPRTERPAREQNREPRVAQPRSFRQEQDDRPERTKRSVAPAIAPINSLTSTNERVKAIKSTKSSASKSVKKLKFYLDLNDHIEAAPSIGPKTAERFEKIGVHTVADFLRQTAESMATKINYKRISADVIRVWQQQARLVCRIPNLRGHDAQLLAACDVTEPEELSTMQPGTLFEIIGPFSETKEGLKIIRNGKKPDLEEITDWISWAQHTRSLQAA